jgi:lactoylglutathione lyase
MAKPTNSVSLNLVVLQSADFDRTTAFYNKLGLTFDRHRHGTDLKPCPEHLAAELAGCVLEFYPATTTPIQPIRIGLKVPNLDATIASFQDAPEAILSPPKPTPWGRRALLKDPDGHKVELTE